MTESAAAGPSHAGSVVLDIGEGTGALVVHAPARLAGLEIHVHGVSAGTTSTHALVRERQLAGASRFAAVFPGLPEGTYQLADLAGTASVTGGRVTEVRLPEAAAPSGQHQHQHAMTSVR